MKWSTVLPVLFLSTLPAGSALATPPTAGGHDTILTEAGVSSIPVATAIASDDVVFTLIHRLGAADTWFEVLQSTDGGSTFAPFWIYGKEDGVPQYAHDMELAEGAVNQAVIAFREGSWVKVARFAVNPTGGPVAIDNVFDGTITYVTDIDLHSDAATYSSYYLYMVFVGDDNNGDDIWFLRSVDRGLSWEAGYKIAEQTTSNFLVYRSPRITDGDGGFLHVGFIHTENIQDTFDDAVLYQRATGWADSGAASWLPTPTPICSDNDGLNQRFVDIAASSLSNEVLVLYQQEFNVTNLIVQHSADAGTTWPSVAKVDSGLELQGDLAYRASTGEFLVAGCPFSNFNPTSWHDRAFRASPDADPLAFGSTVILSDASEAANIGFAAAISLNPARGDQVALTWNYAGAGINVGFDAEWRGTPGYPDLEWAVNRDVAGAATPPALVNVDADMYDEILFSDADGRVHLLSHLGTEVGGWPVDVGSIPADGALAVGDLNGDGTQEIVVGTVDGKVYALAPDASILPGFPVDMGTGASTYVSIGAVGGPYPRSIVVCSGQYLRTLNFHGAITWSASGFFVDPLTSPAAIGDLDGDGVAEIVTAKGTAMHVHRTNAGGNVAFRIFPGKLLAESPSLADLDLDGDLEIVVPTQQGDVYVLEHDGTNHPGPWPYSNPGGGAVHAVALANMLGHGGVELAFVQSNGDVNVLWEDGAQGLGYPRSTGATLAAGPTVDLVNRVSPNTLFGTDDGYVWSVENLGGTPPDFPRDVLDPVVTSTAVGDIDRDGNLELVVITAAQVLSFDLHQAPNADAKRRWPMYGYDPQRTGCLDCVEDLATAASPLATALSFAPPSPNPSSGTLFFRYSLPEISEVSLEIFDVRGRRVRTVVDRRLDPGDHTLGFDGRDRNGSPLANGQYFGRLTVRGAESEQTLTRKFSVVK